MSRAHISRMYCHLRHPIVVLALLCALFSTQVLAQHTASFTDSRGRTLLYRYSLKESWDPDVPRGVLIRFHGNNTGTQENILDWFFYATQLDAHAHDLIPVVVASPDSTLRTDEGWHTFVSSRPYNGHGRRGWGDADMRLVHELLQNHLDGRVRIDHDRVVFWGDSQGTCFLNRFVQRYGGRYGGGFLANCGCSEGPESLWQPPEEFNNGFRVFVRAATEDFLHTLSLQSYGYYKYVIGLETRGDLAREGGHCSEGNVSERDAIGWLLGEIDLPDESGEMHLERVSTMDRIVGITVDPQGTLWAVRKATGQRPTTVWRSVDRGQSLEPVSQIPLDVYDIDAVHDALILTTIRKGTRQDIYGFTTETRYHRSMDGGKDFELLDLLRPYRVPSASTTDRSGNIYVLGASDQSPYVRDVYASDDLGESWTSLGRPSNGFYILLPDPIATEDATAHLFLRNIYAYGGTEWIGTTRGNGWTAIGRTPRGIVLSPAWDGETLWGFGAQYGRMHSSVDRGRTWKESPLPKAATIAFGLYYPPQISALGHGELFLLGGGYDGFLRDGQGTWQQIHGGASIGFGPRTTIGTRLAEYRIAIDHTRNDIFVSDGQGIFRLDGAFRPAGRTLNVPDTDHDGVPDAIDAFPGSASEYLDTDGDGVGNNEDGDDDNDGVTDREDGVPLDRFESIDTDGDGVGNVGDLDDDSDGVLDVFDAFPLDAQEQADSDGDGIGDWSDDDDDGDGTTDVEDAFPLYPHESLDTDGDGIGNRIDQDDDNDGLSDWADPDPKQGDALPHLAHVDLRHGYGDDTWNVLPIALSPEQPKGYTYPDSAGQTQAYGHVTLGDGPDPDIQFMVDYQDGATVIHFDRNDNGDLTDDGPPTPSDEPPGWLWLEVRYSSGVVVPYGLRYDRIADGEVQYGGAWIGDVYIADDSRVLVLPVDYDIDGLFTGEEDYVCVDADGDRRLRECLNDGSSERFKSGDAFLLDGEMFEIVVADSGHRVELRPRYHSVSLFPSASHPSRQGFVRVINRSAEDGTVRIDAMDDSGAVRGPVTLTVGAAQAVQFNSDDLERGSPDKGLSSGVGAGTGAWRLELRSDLDIDVLSYIRAADGFLTSIHDTVPRHDDHHRVPIFNPGSNMSQVSRLRLSNTQAKDATVVIEGTDDRGRVSGRARITVPAGASRTLSAMELETGEREDLQGALGDGTGKWRLSVASDRAIRVMSLMESPTGHLTNLSTGPPDEGTSHFVPLFPSATHPRRQGFVRVINHGAKGGTVRIEAVDDSGAVREPVTLTVGAAQAVHFNSGDLEGGNPDKGLSGGIGAGTGAWRLELRSELDIDVLSYIRAADGFLTSIHDTVPRHGDHHLVSIFNPGSNMNQVSRLRLTNPGAEDVTVVIEGTDNAGQVSPRMQVTVPAGASRTLSATDLETGEAEGLLGALGDGDGKWRLRVASDRAIRVMNLMESPTGHLTNLSTAPGSSFAAKVSARTVEMVSAERQVEGPDASKSDLPISPEDFFDPSRPTFESAIEGNLRTADGHLFQ